MAASCALVASPALSCSGRTSRAPAVTSSSSSSSARSRCSARLHSHAAPTSLPAAWKPTAPPAGPPCIVTRPRRVRSVRAAAEDGDVGGIAAVVGGAVAVVGAAAVLLGLQQRGGSGEGGGEGKVPAAKVPCSACSGVGICAACQGEGFVSKAGSGTQRARGLGSSPNVAQRNTARLSNKWRYCVACNGARVCGTCEGRGTVDA